MIGFIAAGVPQGATKRAVFVPNVQVTLRTAGGTTLKSTLSDLSGRFQFTPVKNGTLRGVLAPAPGSSTAAASSSRWPATTSS